MPALPDACVSSSNLPSTPNNCLLNNVSGTQKAATSVNSHITTVDVHAQASYTSTAAASSSLRLSHSVNAASQGEDESSSAKNMDVVLAAVLVPCIIIILVAVGFWIRWERRFARRRRRERTRNEVRADILSGEFAMERRTLSSQSIHTIY